MYVVQYWNPKTVQVKTSTTQYKLYSSTKISATIRNLKLITPVPMPPTLLPTELSDEEQRWMSNYKDNQFFLLLYIWKGPSTLTYTFLVVACTYLEGFEPITIRYTRDSIIRDWISTASFTSFLSIATCSTTITPVSPFTPIGCNKQVEIICKKVSQATITND